MNLSAEATHAVAQDTMRRSQSIGRSLATRLAFFLTAGLFLAIPYLKGGPKFTFAV